MADAIIIPIVECSMTFYAIIQFSLVGKILTTFLSDMQWSCRVIGLVNNNIINNIIIIIIIFFAFIAYFNIKRYDQVRTQFTIKNLTVYVFSSLLHNISRGGS